MMDKITLMWYESNCSSFKQKVQSNIRVQTSSQDLGWLSRTQFFFSLPIFKILHFCYPQTPPSTNSSLIFKLAGLAEDPEIYITNLKSDLNIQERTCMGRSLIANGLCLHLKIFENPKPSNQCQSSYFDSNHFIPNMILLFFQSCNTD